MRRHMLTTWDSRSCASRTLTDRYGLYGWAGGLLSRIHGALRCHILSHLPLALSLQLRDITDLPVSQLPLQVQAWDAIKKARRDGRCVPEFVWEEVSPAKQTMTHKVIKATEGYTGSY
jgi:hypothetical protein